MHSPSGASLPRDSNTGDLNGLVVLLGHVQLNSGNGPLYRPGYIPDSRNFLGGPLVRNGAFGCQSVGKLFARMHPEGLVPGPQGPFARVSFHLHDKDCRSLVLNSHPVLVPQIAARARQVRPPSLGRGHGVLIVGNQNQGDLAWRKAGRLYHGVDLGTGDGLLGARETASSAENQRRCEHIGEIEDGHSQPQRQGPPVPSRNMIRQLF